MTPTIANPAFSEEIVSPLVKSLSQPEVILKSAISVEQDDLLLKKLGVKGWGRVQHFLRFYSECWGHEREGQPVSPRSLASLLKFLEAVDFGADWKPRVYLTDDGHFELAWEDADGKSVQVEFTSQNGVEYYLESQDIEGSTPLNQLSDLAKVLAR
jgi:hypothetical protein